MAEPIKGLVLHTTFNGTNNETIYESALDRVAAHRKDRMRQIFYATRAVYEAYRSLKRDSIPEWGADRQRCIELSVMMDDYDLERHWSPFKAGNEPTTGEEQRFLNEIANTFLGDSPNINPSGARRHRGWERGPVKKAFTSQEIEEAAVLGRAALEQHQSGMRRYIPTKRAVAKSTTLMNVVRDDSTERLTGLIDNEARLMDKYRGWAEICLQLASVHQLDAIRLAFVDRGIDPVFAGPIVAEATLGGARGTRF